MYMIPHLRHFCLISATTLLLLAGCAGRPPATMYPRQESHAFEDTSNTALAKAYGHAIQRHTGESGFRLLSDGPEALMMRIAMVNAAERSIDLQYFDTREDKTGKLVLEAICRAADRGVRVRMLLDDWNLDDFEAGAVILNANPHIEIRVFNPYSTRNQSIFSRIANAPSYFDQFTRRMHNKAIIVDNQIAIMGGRNLGDEYFEAGKEINLQDVDIFSVGPVVRSMSQSFDRYWNGNESFPMSALNLPAPVSNDIYKLQDEMAEHWDVLLQSHVGRELKNMPLPHEVKKGEVPLIWAKAKLAADNPDKVNQSIEDSVSAPGIQIDKLANNARHEFIILTPYFVPMKGGVTWLNGLVKRGVAVRIVTNSLSSTDMVPAQAGYSHYREALVKGGVELYEIKSSPPKSAKKHMFKPSSQNGLHAKIYMIDRQDLVIGSFNFDPRSLHLNTEQALVIHSPALCAQISRIFEGISSPQSSYRVMLTPKGTLVWVTEEDGKTVYYDFNPHAGFWRIITNDFFAILPIDDDL